MRALVCLALIALVAAPMSRAADPPDPDSAQAKRERFMNGGDLPPPTSTPTQSSAESNPSPTDQTGPSTDVPAPASPTPLSPVQQWLGTVEALPNGGWQYLTSGGGGDTNTTLVYFSTHQIIVDGSKVTAWFRWEYQNPQVDGVMTYRSSVTREEIDCTKEVEITISVGEYTDQNLGGSLNSEVFDPKTARWSPFIPGTLGEEELDWACNKVLKSAHQRRAH